MDISNWIPLYKFDDSGKPQCMTQQTYEPLVSPDGKTYCANYDWQNKYQRIWQPDRVGYTEEVVDYFFYKEIVVIAIKQYTLYFMGLFLLY